MHQSIVTVCMAVAKARDPGGVAFKKPNSFRAIHAAGLRKPCYSAILDLVDYSFKSSQTCDAWKATLKAVLLVSQILLYFIIFVLQIGFV